MHTRLALFPLALILPACGVAERDAFHDHVSDSAVGDDSGTTEVGSSSWPGPISTLTTTPAESEGDASTAGDTDTDNNASEALPDHDPPGPPRILAEPEITPNPIQTPGRVRLTVTTEDAAAVRLAYDVIDPDEGDFVDLVPGETPGTFVADLPAFTSLHNGWKYIVLTPTRGDKIGASVHAKYQVALAGKAGTAGFWEAGDLIGPGAVAAMGMLPDRDVVELGTRDGECYLRRRAPNGSWAASDVITLLPGTPCDAVDMKISGETIFALVHRKTKAGVVWWLAEIESFGAEPVSRGLGAKGEEVYALAERGGTVAVCGTAPTQGEDGIDALIQIFPPNQSGDRFPLDYRPDGISHKYGETARDCIFAPDEEDTLLVVGDAFGKHGNKGSARSRRFLLTLSGGQEDWVIDDYGDTGVAQSFATALDVSDQGDFAVAGYLCSGDPCEPQSRLWLGEYHIPLGYPPAGYLGPSDVMFHPAGYAVVASAGDPELWAFTVRAFWPDATPAWTFIRKDPPQIHLARSVLVGALGEIWIGGWGASGYPAVANIYP